MAITTTTSINCEFVFPNGNKFRLKYNDGGTYSLFYADKEVRYFKGTCKAMNFYNINDELDGCVIKVKNEFDMIYYIVVNSEKTFLRDSPIKCFELIRTLENDKDTRIKAIEELKVV